MHVTVVIPRTQNFYSFQQSTKHFASAPVRNLPSPQLRSRLPCLCLHPLPSPPQLVPSEEDNASLLQTGRRCLPPPRCRWRRLPPPRCSRRRLPPPRSSPLAGVDSLLQICDNHHHGGAAATPAITKVLVPPPLGPPPDLLWPRHCHERVEPAAAVPSSQTMEATYRDMSSVVEEVAAWRKRSTAHGTGSRPPCLHLLHPYFLHGWFFSSRCLIGQIRGA